MEGLRLLFAIVSPIALPSERLHRRRERENVEVSEEI